MSVAVFNLTLITGITFPFTYSKTISLLLPFLCIRSKSSPGSWYPFRRANTSVRRCFQSHFCITLWPFPFTYFIPNILLHYSSTLLRKALQALHFRSDGRNSSVCRCFQSPPYQKLTIFFHLFHYYFSASWHQFRKLSKLLISVQKRKIQVFVIILFLISFHTLIF